MPGDSIERGKTAYLTFDDSPSENTGKILDIFRREEIKVTLTGMWTAGMPLPLLASVAIWFNSLMHDTSQLRLAKFSENFISISRSGSAQVPCTLLQ
ncbi:MAG: polysaccharide deacetylase family protein [Clostridiales bacterium]|nr:polysaccharide deacetylase family protein [Clostridiales bacterium]